MTYMDLLVVYSYPFYLIMYAVFARQPYRLHLDAYRLP